MGRLVIVHNGWDADELTRAKLLATAKLFAAAVPRVDPAPARITLPVCDPLEPLVTTALGGPVTVRRDSLGKKGLACKFATDTTSVGTGVRVSPTAAQDVANYSSRKAPIPGINNAFYAEGEATALLTKTTRAWMTLYPLVPDEAKAIALFKAVMKLKPLTEQH